MSVGRVTLAAEITAPTTSPVWASLTPGGSVNPVRCGVPGEVATPEGPVVSGGGARVPGGGPVVSGGEARVSGGGPVVSGGPMTDTEENQDDSLAESSVACDTTQEYDDIVDENLAGSGGIVDGNHTVSGGIADKNVAAYSSKVLPSLGAEEVGESERGEGDEEVKDDKKIIVKHDKEITVKNDDEILVKNSAEISANNDQAMIANDDEEKLVRNDEETTAMNGEETPVKNDELSVNDDNKISVKLDNDIVTKDDEEKVLVGSAAFVCRPVDVGASTGTAFETDELEILSALQSTVADINKTVETEPGIVDLERSAIDTQMTGIVPELLMISSEEIEEIVPVVMPMTDRDGAVGAETETEAFAEAMAEPGAEAMAEPGAEAMAEPGAEAMAEPGAEAMAEPGAEAMAEPGAEAMAEPGAEAMAEPGAEAMAEPGAEAMAEPGAEAMAEPGAEAMAEPGAEAMAEPGAEAMAEPGAEAMAEPGAEAMAEPGAEAMAEPGAEAMAEPGAEAMAEPGAEAMAEPGAEAMAEPGAEAMAEPGAEAMAEPGAEAIPKDGKESTVKVMDAAADANITDAAADANITDTAADANIMDTAADANITDTAADANITDTAADAKITDTAADANIMDTAADANIMDTAADAKLTDVAADAKIMGAGADAGTTNHAIGSCVKTAGFLVEAATTTSGLATSVSSKATSTSGLDTPSSPLYTRQSSPSTHDSKGQAPTYHPCSDDAPSADLSGPNGAGTSPSGAFSCSNSLSPTSGGHIKTCGTTTDSSGVPYLPVPTVSSSDGDSPEEKVVELSDSNVGSTSICKGGPSVDEPGSVIYTQKNCGSDTGIRQKLSSVANLKEDESSASVGKELGSCSDDAKTSHATSSPVSVMVKPTALATVTKHHRSSSDVTFKAGLKNRPTSTAVKVLSLKIKDQTLNAGNSSIPGKFFSNTKVPNSGLRNEVESLRRASSGVVDENEQTLATKVDENEQILASKVDGNEKILTTKVDENEEILATKVNENEPIVTIKTDKNEPILTTKVDENEQILATNVDENEDGVMPPSCGITKIPRRLRNPYVRRRKRRRGRWRSARRPSGSDEQQGTKPNVPGSQTPGHSRGLQEDVKCSSEPPAAGEFSDIPPGIARCATSSVVTEVALPSVINDTASPSIRNDAAQSIKSDETSSPAGHPTRKHDEVKEPQRQARRQSSLKARARLSDALLSQKAKTKQALATPEAVAPVQSEGRTTPRGLGEGSAMAVVANTSAKRRRSSIGDSLESDLEKKSKLRHSHAMSSRSKVAEPEMRGASLIQKAYSYTSQPNVDNSIPVSASSPAVSSMNISASAKTSDETVTSSSTLEETMFKLLNSSSGNLQEVFSLIESSPNLMPALHERLNVVQQMVNKMNNYHETIHKKRLGPSTGLDCNSKSRSTQTSVSTSSRSCQTDTMSTSKISSTSVVSTSTSVSSKVSTRSMYTQSSSPASVPHLPTRKLVPSRRSHPGESVPVYQRCVECLRNGVYDITSCVYCDTCDVPLCVVPCFRAYHVLGKRH
ncbi:endochitinase A-like [Hyalella azteca]|uniref:Endochitinase A-like n=1 Tax=Hyalella azteca TaxID=294128 RepID=A0A8B7N1N8_HYAAZ|nr:endochitinase A-like [Hyalella azteca]